MVMLNSFMRYDHVYHLGGKTAENSVCLRDRSAKFQNSNIGVRRGHWTLAGRGGTSRESGERVGTESKCAL
jgi:hypothetical protein